MPLKKIYKFSFLASTFSKEIRYNPTLLNNPDGILSFGLHSKSIYNKTKQTTDIQVNNEMTQGVNRCELRSKFGVTWSKDHYFPGRFSHFPNGDEEAHHPQRFLLAPKVGDSKWILKS